MTGQHLPVYGEFAEAGADHRETRTGFALVVGGLSLVQQGLAVLGQVKFGLRRIFLNTASTVSGWGGGWAAERQRVDRVRSPVPAQDVRVPLVGRETGVGEQVEQPPVPVVEVEPIGLVVDDAHGVGTGETGRSLEGVHVHAGEILWSVERGLAGEGARSHRR